MSLSALTNRQAALSNSVGRVAVAPHIQGVPGGGRADFGLLKVLFPADVNGTRPVAVTAADGRQLAFRPRGLAWYDTSTGQRGWLAQITNRLGFIRDMEVVWTNAFDSVRADLRLRYSPRGHRLEQDVILRQRPPLPNGLLAENARLEVWTEWFDSVPTTRVAQTVDLRRGSGITNLPPVLVSDESLTFGASRVGAGFAFSTGTPEERTTVAKAWFRVSGRDWLVETVDYSALKRKLDALAGGTATNSDREENGGALSSHRYGSTAEQLIASLTAGENEAPLAASARLAAISPDAETEFGAPGVVLDFALLSCVPVPPNAVSWWPAGGNANDVLGGHDGVLKNSATYGPGEVGQGFSLPPWDEATETGGDGFVRVPDHEALHFSNALTVEAWINPHDFDWYHEIISTWDAVPGQNQKSYTTALSPDGHCYFGLNPTGRDGQDACIISSNAVVAGTWTHMAATYDGSVMRLYLNGELEAEGVYTNGIFAGTNDLGIGACIGGASDYSPVSPFIGEIDEPALYRRAMSASEIKTIYDAGTAGKMNPNCLTPPSDLAAWYPADVHPYDVSRTNLLTLYGGASYAAAVVSHGINFDGDNDAATAPPEAKLDFGATDDLSLELWLQWKATEFSYDYGVQSLAGRRHTEDSVQGYELFLIDGVLGFQMADGENFANYIASGPDLRDGGWHHVAVSVDRDDSEGGRLYVDGTMVLEFDPTSIAGSLANSEPLRVGAHPDGGLHCNFSGVLDELSVYRRALSGTEVAQLYEAGGAGKCRADVDNDGMQDWWEMRHFGTLDRDGTGDYDGDGNSDLSEFQNGVDPNKIRFYTVFDNLRVNGNSATGTVSVLAGVPAKIGLLMDDTNCAAATWFAYSSNFIANLGASDGEHFVYVGLKGRADDSLETWCGYQLTRDTVPALVAIANPAPSVVFQPVIQLQGYSVEPLARVRFDLTNAAGVLTNLEGFVVKQIVDTNTLEITTNFFECSDVELAEGTNQLALRFTDEAGNVTSLACEYIYVPPTNPAVLALVWPLQGASICGTDFTLRARLSDPTATLTAEIIGGGVTNTLPGIVEPDGKVWVENLPLAAGNNSITLVATDIATNMTSTNFTVVQSALQLSFTPPDGATLNQPFVTINGAIDSTAYKVWVNGIEATNHGDGTWTAELVPVNEGGAAVIEARAIPLSDNGGNGSGGNGGESATFDNPGNPSSAQAKDFAPTPNKDPEIVMIHYDRKREDRSEEKSPSPDDCCKVGDTDNVGWDLGTGGERGGDNCFGWPCRSDFYYEWYTATYDKKERGILKYGPFLIGHTTACGDRSENGRMPYTLVKDWQGEKCGIYGASRFRVTGPMDGWKDTRDKRKAKTLYELHTGGKGSVAQAKKSLFVLTADVEGVGNPFYQDWINGVEPKGAFPINPAQVQLGDLGTLGSDGRLYVVRPDNKTYNATPKVAGVPYYTCHPSQTKHSLRVTANSQDCQPLSWMFLPKFIVGQYVTFQSSWDQSPPLSGAPPGLEQSANQWIFGGTFFNDKTVEVPGSSYPTCSLRYRKNEAMLLNDPTTAWWVSGSYPIPRAYHVTLYKDLRFENGQQTTMKEIGSFAMYRPDATVSPRTTKITADLISGWQLSFFDKADFPPDGITFRNTLNIPGGFTGAATWIQVDYASTRLLVGDDSTEHVVVQRGPGPWADPVPYPRRSSFYTDAPVDSPGLPLRSDCNLGEAGDSFRMWMMFQADVPGEPVPLRAISWSWSGIAVKSEQGLTWTLLTDQDDYSVGPVEDTEVYPVWRSPINESDWVPDFSP